MQSIGDKIRLLREEKQLPLRKIAALLDIDTSYYSKIERSEKKATKEQILKLETIFELEKNSLLIPFLSEKIFYEIAELDCAEEVLEVAEKQIRYKKAQKNKI